MRLSFTNLELLISAIKKQNSKALLIYGENNYLKRLILSYFKHKFYDASSWEEVDYNEIKSDIGYLENMVLGQSLFSNNKVIHIFNCPNAPIKAFFSILYDVPNGVQVIISAASLPPSAALRKTFEEKDIFAALPCYEYNRRDVEKIILEKLQKEGFKFDKTIILRLCEQFSDNVMLIFQELEKLISYKFETKYISEQDYLLSVCNNNEDHISSFVHQFAVRNLEKAMKNVSKLLDSGENAVTIIRFFINFFMRLRTIKILEQEGKSSEEAMKTLTPPVFFKDKPTILVALKQWSLQDITDILIKSNELELNVKKHYNLQQNILEKFIIDHLIPIPILK